MPRKLPLALINSWGFTHACLNPFFVKVKVKVKVKNKVKIKVKVKVKVKSAEEAATGADQQRASVMHAISLICKSERKSKN